MSKKIIILFFVLTCSIAYAKSTEQIFLEFVEGYLQLILNQKTSEKNTPNYKNESYKSHENPQKEVDASVSLQPVRLKQEAEIRAQNQRRRKCARQREYNIQQGIADLPKVCNEFFQKTVNKLKILNSSVSLQYFFKIVDFNGDAFAYAPAIIREDSLFKVIFCSSGKSRTAWDFIRYTDSASWKNRKNISVVLQPTSRKAGDHRNRSTCDPSLVKTSDGWYYIYFTGNSDTRQAAIFLARTRNLGNRNSYQFYVGSSLNGVDKWGSALSSEPFPIVVPKNSILDVIAKKKGWYGAGHQAIVKIAKTWYMWYYDDTDNYKNNRYPKKIKHSIYLRTSSDGIHWGKERESFSCLNNSIWTRCINSMEVKFNPASNQFVMFYIDHQHTLRSSLGIRTSYDGLLWSEEKVLCDEACFPNYSHNLGVSSDYKGHLSSNEPTLIGFGAPFKGLSESKDNFKRPAWDLYGAYLQIENNGGIKLLNKQSVIVQ